MRRKSARGCERRTAAGAYLAGVGVHRPDVLLALVTLQHDLLHVDADLPHALALELHVDEVQELLDVSQQFLRDAFACAVDGHLEVGAAVQHGGGEHADRDGLPEASGRGDQHLLRQMVPAVDLQDALVVLREHPMILAFPEDARARADEVVVEHALVEGAQPPPPVDGFQGLPALGHAFEPVAFRLARHL